MTGLTVDDILAQIGSLGFYQLRLISILSFVEWVNLTFQIMLSTFVSAEPPWKCVANSSTCTLSGLMGPTHKNYSLRCDLKRSDWEFSADYTSVVTEFDLVCDNTFLASVSSSILFASWLLMSILSGILADKIGRKPVMIFFGVFAAVFGLLSAFPRVYWLYTLFRLLVGLGVGGCGMSVFVLATEFVGLKHRHVAGTALWYSWALGLLSLCGLAYAIRNWRTLVIVLSAPGLLFIASWWFVPESVRYLLLKGKHQEAEKVLRHIAHVNKKDYPSDPLHDPTQDGVQKMGDLRDLFRSKKMIHRTLVSWYTWFVNALVYYGVSFSSPSLGGNMYFNFFVVSVIEIPSNWVSIHAMGKFGRKKTLIIGLILAAFASIGAVVVTMYDPGDGDKGFYAGIVIMAVTAKFFVTMSFAAIYVYSAELFPTVVRNVGMGSSTAAGRIGSFCAPYVVQLNRVHPLLPFGLMTTQAFLAGICCLTLPETKDMPTEETMSVDVEKVVPVNGMEVNDPKQEKDEREKVEDEQAFVNNAYRIEVAEQQDKVKKDKRVSGQVNTAF